MPRRAISVKYLSVSCGFGRSMGKAAVRGATVGAQTRSTLMKRCFDASASGLLLVLWSPLILAVAIAIKLDSRGPVLYTAARVGHRGGELRMLKFRKMHVGASGSALTLVGDARFTRLGRWLARSKIDEIPQLWNVLRGDMSLVGPRPEDPGFVATAHDQFAAALEAKPGITGLSQLAFARESEILDPQDRERDYVARILPQKLQLDELYAQRSSFAMDLAILSWTFAYTVLRHDVAVDRTTGRLSRRRTRAPRPVGATAEPQLAMTRLEAEVDA